MNPIEAYDRLRIAIPQRPDLVWRNWPKQPDEWPYKEGSQSRYRGFCYIAAQVFCHLVPNAKPWCTEGRTHFWAVCGETIYDPTFDQFSAEEREKVYEAGRVTRFTGLTKRSNELLKECMR